MQCCARCSKTLQVEAFGISMKGDRLKTCMICQSYNKQRKDNNREDLKEKARQYYQTVRESKLEYVKQYRQENSEKLCERQHCDCGGKYQKQKKWNHCQTMKHKMYLERLVSTSNEIIKREDT